MSSYQRIVITSEGTTADFNAGCDLKMGGLDAVTNLGQYFEGVAGGTTLGASIQVNVGTAFASGAVTFASTGPANGETMTLLNETFEAVTSGADPDAGEFNISATPATVAASFVTAVQAVLGDYLTVSRVSGVVTVTSKVPGLIGNGLQIANVDLANVTIGDFSGGSDGTAYTLDFE